MNLGTITLPGLAAFQTVLNSAISLILAIAGLLFFFYLLFSGIRYLTAGGDEKSTAAAQKSITTAILGLIIVIATYFIVGFIGNLLGYDFLQPFIPGL